MNFFRLFLFPFAILYSTLTSFRNFLFDIKIFRSVAYKNPTLGIGNLSVGGTGKSVCVDYVVSFLKQNHSITILSRGYGRTSKGFLEVSDKSTAVDVGDEPLMLSLKHPEVRVAVAERRRLGMGLLLKDSKKDEVFVWDDCFQHRWVIPRLMIILTSYKRLFVDDLHLPVGNLRELSSGKKRADVVIVTKCPKNMSVDERKKVSQKLGLSKTQYLFFSQIKYSDHIKSVDRSLPVSNLVKLPFLLVTGISDPTPLKNYLERIGCKFEHLKFSDHHNFTQKDAKKINNKSNNRMILTTEKDFVRLNPILFSDVLFYLQIEMELFDEDKELFDKLLETTVAM